MSDFKYNKGPEKEGRYIVITSKGDIKIYLWAVVHYTADTEGNGCMGWRYLNGHDDEYGDCYMGFPHDVVGWVDINGNINKSAVGILIGDVVSDYIADRLNDAKKKIDDHIQSRMDSIDSHIGSSVQMAYDEACSKGK
jgi:hypothetical protein